MKKKILPILMMSLFCTSCGQSINYSIEEYRTTLEFHDDFKILQLTDLHLGIESDLAKQLGFLCKSIDEANPDLIILTGDNFMYGSKGIVKNLFKTLNEKCKELTSKNNRLTKFAVTFGNHDNQGDYPRYFINKTILKYVSKDGEEIEQNKYAAFLDYKNDDLHGFANYYIDLVDDRSKSFETADVKYRIHILDSNTYHLVGAAYKYEKIFDDQVYHIKEIYEKSKDKDYIGLAFFHIPFEEYNLMKEQYDACIDKSQMCQGELKDIMTGPYEETIAYEVMRESNIVSFFTGHDHTNYGDFIYNYDSENFDDKAIFSYGVKSTNQLYHYDDMLGYKLIHLKENMTKEEFVSMKNINENFKNVTNRGAKYEEN